MALDTRKRKVKITHLKLDHQLREGNRHFVHEFIHEFGHLLVWGALLAQPKVERIFEVPFSIGAEIEAYWDCWLGPDTDNGSMRYTDMKEYRLNLPGSCDIEREFTNSYWHTIYTEVTESEDPWPCKWYLQPNNIDRLINVFTICYNTYSRFIDLRPVVDHCTSIRISRRLSDMLNAYLHGCFPYP